MTARVYGDISHALGFNHIGDQVIPFCTCGWLGEPTHCAGEARLAGELHLGEI